MQYKASRGGHAPGHLRDALLEWLDAEEESETVVVGYEERTMPLSWLLGQLWNCTDGLPGPYCHELGLPSGSSYAQGVRSLAEQRAA